MTNALMVVGVLGAVLCLVGLAYTVTDEGRGSGELVALLVGLVACVVVAMNPGLLPSLVARGVGLPEPEPVGPPPGWLFWLAGVVFVVGNVGLIVAVRVRRGRPHRPFCTCAACYRAAVERGEVAAMVERYRVAEERADGAAVVRAANAIRQEYLQVGGQWYRKVPRSDGWINVVRVAEPDR